LDVLLAVRNLANFLQIGRQQIVRLITERLIPVLHNISPDDGRIHQPPWMRLRTRRQRDLTRNGSAEMSLSGFVSRSGSCANTSLQFMRRCWHFAALIASFAETRETRRKNFQFVGKDFRESATTMLVAPKQGGDSHQNGETYREPAQIEKAQWFAGQGVGINPRHDRRRLRRAACRGAGSSAQEHG
jgi:hypothetical protein